MRRFVIQFNIILGISLCCGFLFNILSTSSLSIFSSYTPTDKSPIRPKDKNIPANLYFQEVDQSMVKQLLMENDVVIVDARSREFFSRGHIPRSISLPLFDFDQHYPELKDLLSKAKIIVTYCSSNGCPDSKHLAQMLYALGHQNVMVYTGGFEDWTASGNSIDQS